MFGQAGDALGESRARPPVRTPICKYSKTFLFLQYTPKKENLMQTVTTSIVYAEDVPTLLAVQTSWPVGEPVCVKNKKSGNVLATGTVTSGTGGSSVVTIDRRFD